MKDVNEWHERYKERLISVGLLTESEAQDSLEAGLGNYDYNDVPEDSADDEMSYWGDE
jgi:hypothetical protein